MNTSNHDHDNIKHEKTFDEIVRDEEGFIGRKLSPHELDSVRERYLFIQY